MCNKHFLVNEPYKEKHGQCFECFKTTPAGVAKQAERAARKNKRNNSHHVKVQAVTTQHGTTEQQAGGTIQEGSPLGTEE
jgi:hypothetical protein